MGCIKHLIVLLSLGFLSARGQVPTYPKDSTAIVYVVPGSARSSDAYFKSGLIEKAQQIEAERSIESQHDFVKFQLERLPPTLSAAECLEILALLSPILTPR